MAYKLVKSIFVICFVAGLNSNSFAQSLQEDSVYKHQLRFGVYYNINTPYQRHLAYQLQFKTYFNKRCFYFAGIDGSYYNISNNEGDGSDYTLIPNVGIGTKHHFFRIVTFSMAAQLCGYIDRNKFEFKDNSPSSHHKSTGLFIGPEFTLEIKCLNIKSTQISVYGQLRSGIGGVYTNYYFYNANSINKEHKQKEYRVDGLGAIFIGAAIKF